MSNEWCEHIGHNDTGLSFKNETKLSSRRDRYLFPFNNLINRNNQSKSAGGEFFLFETAVHGLQLSFIDCLCTSLLFPLLAEGNHDVGGMGLGPIYNHESKRAKKPN